MNTYVYVRVVFVKEPFQDLESRVAAYIPTPIPHKGRRFVFVNKIRSSPTINFFYGIHLLLFFGGKFFFFSAFFMVAKPPSTIE